MDLLEEEMQRIITAKARARKERAALPFPEKIRILVQMQKRRAAILKTRGKESIVWDIEFDD